jgi:hypothetical protein
MRHIKPVAVVLLALSLGWVGGLSQTSSQTTIIIIVDQSLHLVCVSPPNNTITRTVAQSDIEGSQPFTIGTWSCNVDSLTAFTLNANMVITTNTGISGASVDDFSQTCTSATGGGSPSCGPGGTFGLSPITLGSGGNTAGSLGADFSGDVRLNVSDWDVSSTPPSRSVSGTINYSVSDSTP